MVDRELIERIDGLPRHSFEGEVFRHYGPGYQALSGEGARIHGGRWNPPSSFPVLYLAIQPSTSIAEFYRLAERSGRPPGDLLPRRFGHYQIRLSAVADLSQESGLASVGLSPDDLRSDDPRRCQSVGDAAHFAGFEGILAPSATGHGRIVAVFFDRIRADSLITQVGEETWTELPPPP